ncbi:hypothetical protein D9613_006333 [Agrocybe pediades]|uniref:Uncharacterized protein n=1 Tax=Agrocybe pediades TaxID=84607 RepID=A0A8H4QUE6_9AGAR|nr:hypothetical protein D9613_006333 [Agrocybe pediades]
MARDLPSQFNVVEQPASSPRLLTTQPSPDQPAASTSRNSRLEQGESKEGSSTDSSDSLDSLEEEFPFRVLLDKGSEKNWTTFRSKMDKVLESHRRKDQGSEENWITFQSKIDKVLESLHRKEAKIIEDLDWQVRRFKRHMKVAIEQRNEVVEENGELRRHLEGVQDELEELKRRLDSRHRYTNPTYFM